MALMGATRDNAAVLEVNISDAYQVERMVEKSVAQFGRLDLSLIHI